MQSVLINIIFFGRI